jgi:pilus assembly protein CpaE
MLSLLFKQPHARAQSAPPVVSTPSAQIKPVPVKESLPVVAKEPPIVGVLGAKGGVGSTTIAINLASALAGELGGGTILDANLQQPDAANILGLDVKYSLLDLLGKNEPTADIVDACCNEIEGVPHLKLLSVPTVGQGGLQINLSQIAESLDGVRKFSRSWVIDLPRYLDKHLVTLIDRCGTMLIVFEPTLAGIAAARRWLRLLEELGYPHERTILVVNRAGSKPRITEQEITAALKDLQVCKIPNAYEMAEECTALGAPVVVKYPGSAYSKAIKGLAKQIISAVGHATGKE